MQEGPPCIVQRLRREDGSLRFAADGDGNGRPQQQFAQGRYCAIDHLTWVDVGYKDCTGNHYCNAKRVYEV